MRVRLVLAFSVLGALLLLLFLSGCADSLRFTTLGGTITNADTGANIANALVTVGGKSERSNDSGIYYVTGLGDGKTYHVRVEKDGFHTKEFDIKIYFPGTVRNINLDPL